MHKLAEISSYPGNPPTYASIMVFDGLFSSVFHPLLVMQRHLPTRPACSRPRFGLHSQGSGCRAHASELQLPAGQLVLLNQWLDYLQGQGRLMRPPRDGSLRIHPSLGPSG